jgi:hypothetical protein
VKPTADDNRFDLRPFLYPGFDYAYAKIEKTLKAMGAAATRKPEATVQKEEWVYGCTCIFYLELELSCMVCH